MIHFYCAAVALLAPDTAPQRLFAEVQTSLHKGYRSLEDYSETMRIEVRRGESRQEILLFKSISKDRYRILGATSGAPTFMAGHDGVTQWGALLWSREYMEERRPNREFASEWDGSAPPGSADQSFAFVFQGGCDLRFYSDPPLSLKEYREVTLDGRPALYARAEAVSPRTGKTASLEFWIHPEHWVLLQFEAKIPAPDGDTALSGKVIKQDFAAGLKAEDFSLDKDFVSGFKKVPFPKDPPPPGDREGERRREPLLR
ncbi:MAG: hypothetical protein AB1725_01865 [Armatimonadota bacterium]